MKKYFIYIFTIFLCLNTFAQDYSFSKSIKLNAKTPRFKILGKNLNYIVAERWGAKYHYIDLYNAKLKKVATKDISPEKNEHIKKIWIQPKKGWIIYTQTNKEYTLLQAKQMDARFNSRSTPLLLDSIVERKDLVQENLRMKYSFNEKYLATYMPIFSKGEIDYFSINVFNKELKKTQKLRLREKFIKNGKYVKLLILNDGSIVVVYREQDETNKFKVFYKKVGKDLKTYDLNISNEVFKKIKVEVDNRTKELIIAGFRTSENNKNAANAFFTLKLDLETAKKTEELIEVFTEDFYKLLTGKLPKTEEVSLQTFYINKIIPKTDGGYLVFAESFFVNTETKSIPSIARHSGTQIAPSFEENTYKVKIINYNDIVVYNITDSLQLESVNIISKRQKSTDDNGGYSSFFIFNQLDKLNILFLDEINTNSSLKNYTIFRDIEIDKDYIFNVSQNNIMPVLKMSVQTAPKEILIPSFLNNSFSIIKIVFDEI